MTTKPKISIVVPIHDMKNGEFFLWRLVNSLTEQTFKDWELIITKDGKMAENTNSGIRRARGELIKVLYMDDYFAHPRALDLIVAAFDSDTHKDCQWLISGVDTNPVPYWTDDIETGNNHLGSPSALTFRNHFDDNLLFDERLSWLLDCQLYVRMNEKYGSPIILQDINVNLGIGDHQMTHILTDEEKLKEHELIKQKYGK